MGLFFRKQRWRIKMSQLEALLWTFVFEVPVVVILCYMWNVIPTWNRLGRVIVIAIAASCITHPFVYNGAMYLHWPQAWWTRVYMLEIAAFLLEAWLYKRMLMLSWPRALLFSLLANGMSFGAGVLFF